MWSGNFFLCPSIYGAQLSLSKQGINSKFATFQYCVYKRINVAQTFCQHYDASSNTFFDVIVTLAFRSEYSKATRYVLLDFVKGLDGVNR